jgi:hypothetical protein
MSTWRATLAILGWAACGVWSAPAAASIEGTPHDLSAVAGGASCSFCHTPHGALPGTPLWSHKLSTAVYKIYESSSLEAKVGQPTGYSKLCLSCHDGTVALTETVTGTSGGAYIPAGNANLGTDLSDDHPIASPSADCPLRTRSDRHWGCQSVEPTGPAAGARPADARNQYGNFSSSNRRQMCVS